MQASFRHSLPSGQSASAWQATHLCWDLSQRLSPPPPDAPPSTEPPSGSETVVQSLSSRQPDSQEKPTACTTQYEPRGQLSALGRQGTQERELASHTGREGSG